VPAAAVIPAPRAYINVVAFKKPVVGFEALSVESGLLCVLRDVQARRLAPHNGKGLRHVGSYTVGGSCFGMSHRQPIRRVHTPEGAPAAVTVSKPECSRQPTRLVECSSME